jgi:SAM-dependent methyltransferase
VVCDQADATVIASTDDIRQEVEAVWLFHQRRLRPDTPTAQLGDRVFFSEHPPVQLVQCRRCGLVYRNPTERQQFVDTLYADAPAQPELLRALHDRQLPTYRALARRLSRTIGHPGGVLEVGSYVGGFLAAAREVGVQADGVDINPDINAFTRRLGFHVDDGDIATYATQRTFAAVAIWSTFDQLVDPRAALLRVWTLLEPGGVLALRVPNGAFYARLRPAAQQSGPVGALARLALADNNLLGFPYRYGFSPGSLTRLLCDLGFQPIGSQGDVLVPLADAWTRRWARIEEHAVKALLSAVGARRLSWAPWFESYARRP